MPDTVRTIKGPRPISPPLASRLTMTPREGTEEARLNPGEPPVGRDMSYLYPAPARKPRKLPPYPAGTAEPKAKTLRDVCIEAVDSAAGRLLWREFGKAGRRGIDRIKLRAEVWATEAGRLLNDLSMDKRFATLEAGKGKAKLAGNPGAQAHYGPALAVLAKGRFPEEGPQ